MSLNDRRGPLTPSPGDPGFQAAQIEDSSSPFSRPGTKLHLLTLSYGTIVFAITALAMAIHGFDGDVLMDVNIGQWILTHGHIPLHNYFTQAGYGRPFSDTEWAFTVLVAWAYSWGGRLGVYLSLLPFLLITAGFVGAWAARTRQGLLVVIVAAIGLTITSHPRPQVISYAAFALGLWAIQQARRGRWTALLVFLLAIVPWSNVHSSVVLAPLLLANEAMWNGPSVRYRGAMAAAALMSALLMLIRFGGAHSGGRFIAHVFSSGVANVMSEWQSPNFHYLTGQAILPAIIVAWVLMLPRLWRDRAWATAAWVFLGPLATLWAIRFAPYMILGVVAAAPLCWPRDESSRSTGWRAVVLLAGGISALWAASLTQPTFFMNKSPVAAETYLARHHARNVLAYYDWGSSAEFAGLHPWVNGQAQLWASSRWWMPMIRAQNSVPDIMLWAQRWDPHTQWILWPLSPGIPVQPLAHQLGWQLVQRTTSLSGPVGIWHRVPPTGP